MIARNVRAVVEQGLADGLFPGAVVRVVRAGEEILFDAWGMAEITPEQRPMRTDMWFDLASLTKVMATLPAVLRTLQAGQIDLHAPVQRYVPLFTQPDVTVFHLLTHTSGLLAWLPMYLRAQTPEAIYRHICERVRLEATPGTRVVYSDLGFILLGCLLEAVWNKPLLEVFNEQVFEPLGLDQTFFTPTHLKRTELVATEVGNAHERKMCADYAPAAEIDAFPWRTETLVGEVHDGHAWYGMGGVSSHAGLFSTARDVSRYVEMWAAKGGGYLEEHWVRLATTLHTVGIGDARGLGFQLYEDGAFGHLGFTGTSLRLHPATETQVIALTNRVHPHVQTDLAAWRRALHAAAFQL
ncbi:serine hydrolase [Tumebacillus sp. DT12]|uniref:Serine hydrolase n=1 Tax=Tumebacillus lacus TaxID=2995335 RepID=A0ABT3WVV1_9BACL|nr:serine hydrolase domain-containing protein [Tumebacillus lacus]MCX7568813.1 serine hydrolase [Tumebacillus lacus]